MSYSLALRPAEAAIGREGACDVAGVAVQLAAGVDQHQLAGLAPAPRRRGSAARRHWRRRPRWSCRPGTASRPGGTRAAVRRPGGIRARPGRGCAAWRAEYCMARTWAWALMRGGAPHDVLLVASFTRRISSSTRTGRAAARGTARRSARARAPGSASRPRALQALVDGERVPDRVAVLQQARQALVQLAIEKAASTPSCAGAASGPRR
jgi:hypothetical protein